jgi:negative regulator of flagellin synthesis FlgM
MNIMKIPPYTTNAVGSSGAADGKSATSEKAAATSGAASDTVQLSKNYRDLASTQKSISGTDEIRTDKVQQVKNQLASGTYSINPGEIAGKMMNEVM